MRVRKLQNVVRLRRRFRSFSRFGPFGAFAASVLVVLRFGAFGRVCGVGFRRFRVLFRFACLRRLFRSVCVSVR